MGRIFLLLMLGSGLMWGFTGVDEEPPVYDTPATDSLFPTGSSHSSPSLRPGPAPRSSAQERLIYLQLEKVPEKIYVGEIFPVTLKITTLRKHRPATLSLQGGQGLRTVSSVTHLSPRAIRRVTLLFQATASRVRLPDFVVRYEGETRSYRLKGKTLQAVRLNPPKNFSGLLARDLQLRNYQASAYDEGHNFLALRMVVSYGNVRDFRLPGAVKQGIDSVTGDLNATSVLYTGIFPKAAEMVTFTYFNLPHNRYEKFQVPILVKRSSVSTQTTLDPQASEFTRFKIAATALLIVLWLILWYRRRGWGYPLLILLATAYLLTYLIPLKRVCIRSGAVVYLLPTPQSTPFIRIGEETAAKEMTSRDGFVKVQLPDNHIGWIKHEDLCTH